MLRKWLGTAAMIVPALVIARQAVAASSWKPQRPIEIVAPAGPGGGWDLLARAVQKALTEEKLVDKPVIVVNKPGGGGAAGWGYIRRKKGRGEFLAVTSPLLLQNHILGKSDLTFRDVTPLANLMTEWDVIAVKADAPWRDGRSFFKAMKEEPQNLHIGVGPALGNDDHIQVLLLAKASGADPQAARFVVYPATAAEQIPALLGGHIQAITISLAETLEQVKAGKIRLLGVSAPGRLPAIANTPTWKEQGLDVVLPHWRGLIAAPGLSAAQKAFWAETIDKMVKTPTWRRSLVALDWDGFYQNAEEHQAFLAAQETLLRKTLKGVGLIQ